MSKASHFINGLWLEGTGTKFHSVNPFTGELVWEGHEATLQEADHAIFAARNSFESWCELSFEERASYIKAFQKQLEDNKSDLALTISQEVGKPFWESLTEVQTMINKVTISIEAFIARTSDSIKDNKGEIHATRYKPHGVVAVFGPYNFPGHLANGHIVPALLAGNTVVFKQSEQAPLVAQKTIELWEQADLPKGVINLVQGGRNTGLALASHPGLDGLFFTGSSQTGLALSKQFAEHPEKILALEMGGNNPLVVIDPEDVQAAAYLTVLSSFITSGQRCTCARRLIVPQGESGDAFLNALVNLTKNLSVGGHTNQPEPFMGPVISHKVALDLLAEQERLAKSGAQVLVEMKLLKENSGLVSPGIVDVTHASNRQDKEIFGPLLQVIRVKDFSEAIAEANNTQYGLAAGLISKNPEFYKTFYKKIRAGIVNFNRQLTGASSAAPFGGTGLSGNHRPSAYFAADYCSYPVASMEAEKFEMPKTLLPGITL